MARLSKTQSTNLAENGAPPEGSNNGPTIHKTLYLLDQNRGNVHNQDEHSDRNEHIAEHAQSSEDERRISALTRTSISSMPDSLYSTDCEHAIPLPKSCTPQSARPAPKRLPMTSPLPFGRYSPRNSAYRRKGSRTGTPTKSGRVRGSVLQQGTQEEEDSTRYPLVLLHITLLPVALPWAPEVTQELLPPRVLGKLQLLRSKVSDTVIQRGILIPHPRDEYDLLEERLLEALELKQERITPDGHFRRCRESNGSNISAVSGHSRADSALGSSEDSSDGESCTVCQFHVRSSGECVGTGSQKWSVKVFAANGLMRASAWSACWSEMERVDVEILPWIPDELKRKLNARQQETHAERSAVEEDMIRGLVEEQVRLAREEHERILETERLAREEYLADQRIQPSAWMVGSIEDTKVLERADRPLDDDLPPVYKASQVPLSILMRNYVYLLAQDRRNAVVFFMALFAIFLGLQAFQPSASSSTVTYEKSMPVATASVKACTREESSAMTIGMFERQANLRPGSSMDGTAGTTPVPGGVATLFSWPSCAASLKPTDA